jgi:ubiquinone/menaquinone biosynthesis C-methylase UbiE
MNKTSLSVKKAYDEWAEIYDTDNNPTRDLNAQTLRKASLSLENKRILEVGCGTGLNTKYLAQNAKQVVGLDISEEMLEVARQRISEKNVRFKIGDITNNWNIKTASFDVIVANLVLEHIENLRHVFNEAYRVLHYGGILYIAELHPYKQLSRSQARYVNPKTGEEIMVDAFLHSVSEYVNEALEEGFVLEKIKEHKHKEDEIPRLLVLIFEKDHE